MARRLVRGPDSAYRSDTAYRIQFLEADPLSLVEQTD
jgi:hypothetical protein